MAVKQRLYEVPVIVGVEAESRDEADEKVTDLADSIASTFSVQASALIGHDHNVLERLRIKYDGEPV